MGLQDGEDFGFGEVEAEGFHGDFELVVVDFVVLVQVEEVELVSRWRISTSIPNFLPRRSPRPKPIVYPHLRSPPPFKQRTSRWRKKRTDSPPL